MQENAEASSTPRRVSQTLVKKAIHKKKKLLIKSKVKKRKAKKKDMVGCSNSLQDPGLSNVPLQTIAHRGPKKTYPLPQCSPTYLRPKNNSTQERMGLGFHRCLFKESHIQALNKTKHLSAAPNLVKPQTEPTKIWRRLQQRIGPGFWQVPLQTIPHVGLSKKPKAFIFAHQFTSAQNNSTQRHGWERHISMEELPREDGQHLVSCSVTHASSGNIRAYLMAGLSSGPKKYLVEITQKQSSSYYEDICQLQRDLATKIDEGTNFEDARAWCREQKLNVLKVWDTEGKSLQSLPPILLTLQMELICLLK